MLTTTSAGLLDVPLQRLWQNYEATTRVESWSIAKCGNTLEVMARVLMVTGISISWLPRYMLGLLQASEASKHIDGLRRAEDLCHTGSRLC